MNVPVCPDFRGYWGDYDDMAILGVDAMGTTTFIRPHSSTSGSTYGCLFRDTFTEIPLHVDANTFQ